MDEQLINEILEYIEYVEEKIEGEFGVGKIFEQMLADNDVPEIYNKLKAIQKAV